MTITQEIIDQLLQVVARASTAIMEIYDTKSAVVEVKADQTLLTQADTAANEIITKALTELFPAIPIVSEEGDNATNLHALASPTYWIVDPIDGTKEFVNRTGEFCIAIGLVDGEQPTFGLVTAPTLNAVYYGGPKMGAFKKVGTSIPVALRTASLSPHIVAVSRSHPNDTTNAYIEQHYPGAIRQPLGSMLKQMAMAEGLLDVYPVLGQSLHLWDIAAGQAIIQGAGGKVTRPDGSLINWHTADGDFLAGDFIATAYQTEGYIK